MHKYFLITLLFSCLQTHCSDIIQQALNLQLSACSTTNSVELTDTLYKNVGEKISKDADYQGALECIMQALEQHPDDFSAQSFFAAILGDFAYVSFSEFKQAMTNKSKQVFEKLMQELDGQPKSVELLFKNEYYFRFAQYENQYHNGVDEVNHYWDTDQWLSERGFKGYYRQGVGAAYTAKQLVIKGEIESAKAWAQKSVIAWAQYFSYCNDYYNSYVHYALALGILGYTDEMMKALSHSADLIKKDLDYIEFKDVIDFVTVLTK